LFLQSQISSLLISVFYIALTLVYKIHGYGYYFLFIKTPDQKLTA